MDESGFRQLLGKRWANLLDKRAIARGAALVHSGGVVDAWFEDLGQSGVLHGLVRGRVREPFQPTLTILSDGQRVQTSTTCNCAAKTTCEHVSALVLGVLGLTGKRVPLRAPTGNDDELSDAGDTLREVAPTPILTLREISWLRRRGGVVRRFRLGCVRLSFDYAGERLPFAPALLRERRTIDGREVVVVRDRAAEIAACERLDALSFIDVELLPQIPGLPRGELAEGDFALEYARRHMGTAEQIFALSARLRDQGFELESAADLPIRLVDAPAHWYADIKAHDKSWFDVSLGIEIAGERVDLLPILRRLLADPMFPRLPRKGELDDAVWLVPLDDRRRVPLPLERLRALMAPLLEWMDGGGATTSLRVHRAQTEALEELSAQTDMPWHAGESVRAQWQSLRQAPLAIDAPPGFRAQLRPYQRDGLAWLQFLAQSGLGGILADDMGLGKTVQVLAHLLAEKQAGRLNLPAMVIAPTSLVANWRSEANRFAPDLRVLVIHGAHRAPNFSRVTQHDLIITTYPLLSRDRERLLGQRFSLLILDEAQAIKNARTQAARVVREINAQRRLAMTGTPLENHLGELWAQFDAVEPGLLGDERRFVRHYRIPIEKHGNRERQQRLNRRIAPLMLRRRKEDVLADLPPKSLITRPVELTGRQRELYETLRLAQNQRVREAVGKRGLAQSGIVVLDALLKLRQVCCDPRLLKLDSPVRGIESAKLELLLEMLTSLVAEGRRALVFSQFAQMLAVIAQELDARGLPYLKLTGQTRERAPLVERFQAGEVPIFLISLKAGGVGLNLTAADTVIHYDPWWNPAVEAQASDRAHRIGQDKPVFVYKLICSGTVEEKIQALQVRKADLASAVLEGGGSTQALRLQETDLDDLFAPL